MGERCRRCHEYHAHLDWAAIAFCAENYVATLEAALEATPAGVAAIMLDAASGRWAEGVTVAELLPCAVRVMAALRLRAGIAP